MDKTEDISMCSEIKLLQSNIIVHLGREKPCHDNYSIDLSINADIYGPYI